MADTPQRAIVSIESLNGKKASDATTQPLGMSVFLKAIFVASTLLVWPPEILMILLFFATTIAFDFVCFTTLQAKSREEICESVGFLLVGKERVFNLREDMSFS